MNQKYTILNFHGIGEVQREFEAGEELYWLSKNRFIEVVNFIENHQERDSIRITFDDGNLSDLEIALPCLLERGMTATFFVLSGKFEQTGYLSSKNLLTFINAGMAIGSHGAHHTNWRTLEPKALLEEIRSAPQQIEAAIGMPVKSVAIPFGAYNRRVLNSLKGERVETVFTSDGGSAKASSWLKPRTSIRKDTTIDEIDMLVRSGIGLLRTAKRNIKIAAKHVI